MLMKYNKLQVFSWIISVLVFYACSRAGDEKISSDVVMNPNTANGKTDRSKLPAFKFDEEVHDFGKIIEGETVAFEFRFTNTGKSDLVIASVSSSCGCTVPTYTNIPVHPGKQGSIKVTFNSAGKKGYQTKNVLIAANTQPNVTELRIKANVVSPGTN
jgi:hypothetical protein